MPAQRYENPQQTFETDGEPITVAQLEERCKLLEPGIVHVRHPAHSSAQVFEVLVNMAIAHASPYKRFAIVNDLQEAKHRPRGAYADIIVKVASSVGVHWANVWPSNAFVRTVARFLSARLKSKDSTVTWSFHDNMDGAIGAARAALQKAGGP